MRTSAAHTGTVTGQTGTSAAHEIVSDWQSVNRGGAIAQSARYWLAMSIGQNANGYATGANNHLGIGFWYGATCDCSVWGDVTGDDAVNPADVVVMVNHVYKGVDNRVSPPDCPYEVGDVDCTFMLNPVDVVLYVNYVYKGAPFPCADPCQL